MPPLTAGQRIGALIRARARQKNMNQAQLGLALGLAQSRISDRLRGVIAFNVDELAAIADLLDIPFADLVADAVPAA